MTAADSDRPELPSAADLREALDDLWGCIGKAEMGELQPETVLMAEANHELLWHTDESARGSAFGWTSGKKTNARTQKKPRSPNQGCRGFLRALISSCVRSSSTGGTPSPEQPPPQR